jgi:hypothetical protein
MSQQEDKNSTNEPWTFQRDMMALNLCKQEIKKLKKAFESTKLFLNMVIHDLRNPTA